MALHLPLVLHGSRDAILLRARPHLREPCVRLVLAGSELALLGALHIDTRGRGESLVCLVLCHAECVRFLLLSLSFTLSR